MGERVYAQLFVSYLVYSFGDSQTQWMCHNMLLLLLYVVVLSSVCSFRWICEFCILSNFQEWKEKPKWKIQSFTDSTYCSSTCNNFVAKLLNVFSKLQQIVQFQHDSQAQLKKCNFCLTFFFRRLMNFQEQHEENNVHTHTHTQMFARILTQTKWLEVAV